MAAPFRIQDSLAKAALQTHGDRARTFMHNDIAVVVDKAQRIVTRNRLAAFGNHIVTLESLFTQDIRFRLIIFDFTFFLRLFFFLLLGTDA